jgi:chloride channel protein, CIC family
VAVNEKASSWRESLFPLYFFVLSILTGIVSGMGAVFFRGLISLFHNALFLGKLSVHYDSNIHTPISPLGPGIILVPVLGAIGVTFLVTRFAPEAKGHGVPEVMDAIYYHKANIRSSVAVIKSLASALSIGSGGSVGREGPIVQIGASFGSTLGRILHMSYWQRVTLISAGAGGGIAATFNTPIGGILFAVELMLHEVSVRTIVPVAICTATATFVGRLFFGPNPSFVIPAFQTPYFHVDDPVVLLFYCGLGPLIGGASALFIKSLYAFEDFFDERIRTSPYLRHGLGMLLIGCIIYFSQLFLGHYYVEGVGYATIQDILTAALGQGWILFILFFLKLAATCITLGSGASGGVFSPSLYLGATLGAAYGTLAHLFFPSLQISVPAFAVAGMAGMVGGATGAAVTAIVMIFEMTLNYNVILPITITVALSYGARTFICRESIYTLKMKRRGHILPYMLQTNFDQVRQARELMHSLIDIVPDSMPLSEVSKRFSVRSDLRLLIVHDQTEHIVGTIVHDEFMKRGETPEEHATAAAVVNRNFYLATPETPLLGLLIQMQRKGSFVTLIGETGEKASAGGIKGFVTLSELADALSQSHDLE